MQYDPMIPQLAITEQLLQQGRAEEARDVLKRLHKTHPKNTSILLQYALAERLLKHWPESIALMRKALALEPGNILFLEHLTNVLMYSNVGRHFMEAVGHYGTILKANPDYHAVATNLVTLAMRTDMPQPVLDAITPLLDRPGLEQGLVLHFAAACAVASYLTGDWKSCERFVGMALGAQAAAYDSEGKPASADRYFMLIYAEFIRDLLAFHAQHPSLRAADATLPVLHVVGESHCLTPAQVKVVCGGIDHRVMSHIIMGGKAYFLSLERENAWKDALHEIIRKLPKDEAIIACFGEIDCRPLEGIMVQRRATADYAMDIEIAALCTAYVKTVKLAQLKRKAHCYIMGVPAPNPIAAKDLQPGEEAVFTQMIATFNSALKKAAEAQQLGYLDLYAVTLGQDGWAKDGVHLDHVHLKPSVVAALLRNV